LETDAIGGTWGQATSVLAKRFFREQRPLAISYLGEIRQWQHGCYVVKYFNGIYDHAGEIDSIAKSAGSL
jgi:hypothetical protein